MIAEDVGRLVLEPLGEDAWRLCDTAVEESNAARLVAYVERTADGGFEAIWMGLGIRPTVHASTADVLIAAVEVRRMTVRATHTKPIPIPHRAPIRLRGLRGLPGGGSPA